VSDRRLVVLDSSVGVKWIKPEQGREQARELLLSHRNGKVRIVVPALFIHEVTGVAVRHGGAALGERVWGQPQARGPHRGGSRRHARVLGLRAVREP
jgi:predicted nucleic acid-binding protein